MTGALRELPRLGLGAASLGNLFRRVSRSEPGTIQQHH